MPRREALHHHRPPSALPADFCRATLRTTNRLYRRMRIGAAQRKLSRNYGERFLAPGYVCAPRPEWLCRYRDTMLPKGAHVWYRGDNGLWWLEKKISASTTEDGVSLAQILDDPGPFKLPLFPALHDLRGGRTRFLVPSGSRSQRVLSGGSNVR